MKKNGKITLAAFVAAITLLILHQAAISSYTADDAFISFRYALNLLKGHGLVFNEGSRVEGYTNFLWVMLSAGWTACGIPPELGAKIFSCLISIGLLIMLGKTLKQKSGSSLPLLALILPALDPYFNYWAVSGMETALFVFLIFAAFQVGSDAMKASKPAKSFVAGLLFGTAYLTRPEGILAFALTALFFFFAEKRNNQGIYRSTAFITAGLLLIALPHFIWRYWYYGSLLPNTYYAKTGGGFFQILRGIFYVMDWFDPAVIMLFAAAIISIISVKDKKARAGGFICAGFILYAIKVGGDSLGMKRFMVTLLPFLYFIVGMGLKQGRGVLQAAVLAPVTGILVFHGYGTFSKITEPQVYSRAEEVNHPKAVLGRCLKKYGRDGASVATNVIGRLPFYSELTAYDVFGLTEPHIAHQNFKYQGLRPPGHEKSDPQYILSKRPTFAPAGELVVAPPFVRKLNEFVRKRFDVHDDGFRLFAPPMDIYEITELKCGNRLAKIPVLKQKKKQLHIMSGKVGRMPIIRKRSKIKK